MGPIIIYSGLPLLTTLAFISWQGEAISRDWFPTFFTLAILNVLAILWGILALDNQDRKRAADVQESVKGYRVSGWERVIAKHTGLLQDLVSMQSDDKMRILYPELVRSNHPLADAVVREKRLAAALRPDAPSDCDRVEESAYFRAVERLEGAVKEFVAYAKQSGWDNLTSEQRTQQSIALENYYKMRERNNQPLRSQITPATRAGACG